nr:hypothetical protein Hi04_10k_c1170_00021 [uncultured bacterium]
MIATLILTLLTSPPSFRFGKILRADLHASVNADVNAGNTFDFGRARLGVQGKVLTSDVPEGLNSLKEKGAPEPLVKGRRLRFGIEFKWEPGPFAFKSEWIHVSEARNGQSIRGTDLPDRTSRGWYLTGAWHISKPLQLAGRYEQIRYGSAKPEGMAFGSPRARTLPTTTQNIWTGGVNWFVHPFAKFQFDGVHDGH